MTKSLKHSKTFQVVCAINIFLSFAYTFLNIRNYYDYKSMPGALNGNSFLFMAAFEIVIIAGLSLMFVGKKKGFYLYLIGQLVSFIYPVISGTGDTVWGLLILPALIFPIIFAIFYIGNLKKLH